MNAPAGILLAVTAALAIADWVAVSPPVRSRRAEYVLKPAATAGLVAVALALDPEREAQRAWFVAALLLSLAGDVALMLPADAFVAGLGSFLLAHLAYIVGFALEERSAAPTIAAAVAVAGAAATVGRRILVGVRASPAPTLAVPVAVYMTAISAMAVLAAGTGEGFAIAGAALFFASDAMIAWDRFVRPFAWARPAIMATYHLAQAGLVVSLTR